MCGRYVISEEEDEIIEILREIDNKYSKDVTAKTGEIFPTNTVPILCIQDEKSSLKLMKWGFPKWDGKGVIINAKSETAAEKRMFSKPMRQHRCVILSTGFYEWSKLDNKSKDKYLFNAPDNPLLYMAGLYTNYTSTEKSEQLTERFVILTREANTCIKDIHNRMPVILQKDELVHWLKDYDFATDIMSRDNIDLVRKAV